MDKRIVRLVQGLYSNAGSRVCVGEAYSEEFEVKVGVHQGFVLNRCSSSLCLKPCHVSSAVESHGRTSLLMTLFS